MKIFSRFVLICFLIISVMFGIFEWNVYQNSDDVPPVITAESDEITLSVQDDESAYLTGLSAQDNKDGDVTDSITVTAKSYFINGRTFRVNYAAFDSRNNVGSYSRMVTFSDYTSPHFSINAPLRFSANTTNGSYISNITASDVIDGDLTKDIMVITHGYFDSVQEVSSVPITLQVRNSFGDIQELNVNATVETSATYNQPAPGLATYLLYTPLNTPIDYAAYLVGIWNGGTTVSFEQNALYGPENIQIDASRVDYATPGTYTVSYLLIDRGEVIGTTEMYVVVEG